MTVLLSIDPGLRHCGVGLFRDKTLTRAALVRSPEKKVRGPAAWLAMANAVKAWVGDIPLDKLAVEVMPVYRYDGLQKRRDLLQLQGVVGATCGLVWAREYVGLEPREWKGTVKADVMLVRIEKRLTPAEVRVIEQCPPSLRHNTIDGVGVGLHCIGRLGH